MTRWGVGVALLLSTAAVGAAGPDVSKQYKAAVKLEVAGDVLGALEAFERIPLERRDFNTRLHIAGCKKKLGRFLDAEATYEAIRSDPKADQPTVDTAASDLEDLRARIPTVRVRASGTLAGVTVELDGRAVTVPSLVKLDPGEHVVRAERATEVVFERRLRVDEGSSVEVVVEVPAVIVPVVAPATVTPHPIDRPTTPPQLSSTPAWILAGASAALVGTGVYFAISAADHRDKRDSLAAQADQGAFDEADRARSAQLWGRASLVAAVGTSVLSGYFFWSSRDRSKPHVSLGTGTGSPVALVLSGSW